MDLKVYYQKLRETEASIPEADTVISTLETADGGRPGVLSEVTREVAAKMVVERRARLTTPAESSAFREQVKEACRKAEQIAAASRMQIRVLSEADLKALRSGESKG